MMYLSSILYHNSSASFISFFFSMIPTPPRSTLFPYTTLFRSGPGDTLPQLQNITVTRSGDLWSLRHHRLLCGDARSPDRVTVMRSEEHTSELQSRGHLVCRLLLEKKKRIIKQVFLGVLSAYGV